MVKREQVYSPSSPSVTSLMLIVNSCAVARTSSIRLSLSAAGTNNQESKFNYDTFISICHTLKSGRFSWHSFYSWKFKCMNTEQKGKKIVILWLCSHIVLSMKINCIATGKKYFMMAFSQKANWIWISQDSNPTSLQSIVFRMSIHRFETYMLELSNPHLQTLYLYICRFFTQSSMNKSKVQTYYECDLGAKEA